MASKKLQQPKTKSAKLIKLEAQLDALNIEKAKVITRLNNEERTKDTRRKILVGAFILDRAGRDEQYQGWLIKELAGFLVRPNDRALFGLPPLPPVATVDKEEVPQ